MKLNNINPNTHPNLFNLLNVIDITNQPIIVHDIDSDEDYDITGLIKETRKELGME